MAKEFHVFEKQKKIQDLVRSIWTAFLRRLLDYKEKEEKWWNLLLVLVFFCRRHSTPLSNIFQVPPQLYILFYLTFTFSSSLNNFNIKVSVSSSSSGIISFIEF